VWAFLGRKGPSTRRDFSQPCAIIGDTTPVLCPTPSCCGKDPPAISNKPRLYLILSFARNRVPMVGDLLVVVCRAPRGHHRHHAVPNHGEKPFLSFASGCCSRIYVQARVCVLGQLVCLLTGAAPPCRSMSLLHLDQVGKKTLRPSDPRRAV
jgi:hypothetical protein